MADIPIVPCSGEDPTQVKSTTSISENEKKSDGPSHIDPDEVAALEEKERLWPDEALIYAAVLHSPEGLTIKGVHGLFYRHRNLETIEGLLEALFVHRLIYPALGFVNGRHRVLWVAGKIEDAVKKSVGQLLCLPCN